MKTNIVKVFLWGEEVGHLQWNERTQTGAFTFNPDYIKKGIDVFPLIHPISDEKARAPFFGSRDRYDRFNNLPSFIADSLPDDWGNKVFNDWAERNHIPSRDRSPVDKLSFIGKRAMGALEFVPEAGVPEHAEAIAIENLYEEAKRLFSDRESQVVSTEKTITKDLLYKVGSSAGGQRAKVIIALNPQKRQIRSGQIAGMNGFLYFIMKFTEDRLFPAGAIEKTFYEMAVLSGIDINFCTTMKVDGLDHFMTLRFDRPNGEKIHMLSLASITEGCTTYEDLMRTARRLRLTDAELTEIFRRLCFNVMSGNTDDHDKNFSFLMTPDGKWRLAPAYDLTFTFDIFNSTRAFHAMSVMGKNSDITIKDLQEFAYQQGIRNADKIIRTISRAMTFFRPLAEKNHVNADWIYKIENHIVKNILDADKPLMKTARPIDGFSFTSSSGQVISDIYVIESEKHDYKIGANVDGVPRYRYFPAKKDIAYEIAQLGGTAMTPSAAIHIFETYLLSREQSDMESLFVQENIPEQELPQMIEAIVKGRLEPGVPPYQTILAVLNEYAIKYDTIKKTIPIFEQVGQYMLPVSSLVRLTQERSVVLENSEINTFGKKDSVDNSPGTTVNIGLRINPDGCVVCFDPWNNNQELGTLQYLIAQKRFLDLKQLFMERKVIDSSLNPELMKKNRHLD